MMYWLTVSLLLSDLERVAAGTSAVFVYSYQSMIVYPLMCLVDFAC